jgi:hypothetical protein
VDELSTEHLRVCHNFLNLSFSARRGFLRNSRVDLVGSRATLASFRHSTFKLQYIGRSKSRSRSGSGSGREGRQRGSCAALSVKEKYIYGST